jgi:hypothetical protein
LIYNYNNYFFILTIESVFVHIDPKYSMVNLKRKLIKFYKNCVKKHYSLLYNLLEKNYIIMLKKYIQKMYKNYFPVYKYENLHRTHV